jgi:hypothetical protein
MRLYGYSYALKVFSYRNNGPDLSVMFLAINHLLKEFSTAGRTN